MTREETKKIVDKIQIYRQSFLITTNVYQEWFRILESYDYQDVDNKLDEFFKNGDNFGRYPDVYYLTKYLKKHDEKLKVGANYVKCPICSQTINLMNYSEHYERCSSTTYLCEMSEKYFSKKLNYEKLLNASKSEFEKYYWDFCGKLYDVMDDGMLKHSLKNAILTHYGHEPEYGLENISKGMIEGDD